MSRLSVVIGRFQSILFVSVFQGSLAVAIIVIDSSKKPNHQLGFDLRGRMLLKGAIFYFYFLSQGHLTLLCTSPSFPFTYILYIQCMQE